MSTRNTRKALANNASKSGQAGSGQAKRRVDIRENFKIYEELDSLVESAMRDSLKKAITESAASDADQMKYLKMTESAKFTPEESIRFMTNYISPVLEITNISKPLPMFTDKKRNMRSVPLPVYEIAMTIESARLGRLTEESLDLVVSAADPMPGIEDVEDVIHGEYEKQEFDEKTEAFQTGTPDSLDMRQDAVVAKTGLGENVTDVNQFENNDPAKNDSGIWAKEDPSFEKVEDVEGYEGEMQTPASTGLFNPPMSGNANNNVPSESFQEDAALDGAFGHSEGEVKDQSCGLDDYAGQESKPKGISTDSDLAGQHDPFAEAVQTKIMGYLLAQIFEDYSVTNVNKKKAMVQEAIHYLTRYGIGNLIPNISDSIDLVSYQNALAESYNVPDSMTIIRNSVPRRSNLQEARVQAKVMRSLNTVKNRRRIVTESYGQAAGQKQVMRDSAEIFRNAKANSIENARQAFRFRMAAFTESAKEKIAKSWRFVETAETPNAMKMAKHMTAKRYVSEGGKLKSFLSILKNENPVLHPCLKKSKSMNESMAVAALVTENASSWKKLNKKHCSTTKGKRFLECKIASIATVKEQVENFISICESATNSKTSRTLLRGIANGWDNLKSVYVNTYKKLS